MAFGDEKQWNRIDQRCEALDRNREAVHRRGEDLTSNGEGWSRIVENEWQCNGEAWSRRDEQWNGKGIEKQRYAVEQPRADVTRGAEAEEGGGAICKGYALS